MDEVGTFGGEESAKPPEHADVEVAAQHQLDDAHPSLQLTTDRRPGRADQDVLVGRPSGHKPFEEELNLQRAAV